MNTNIAAHLLKLNKTDSLELEALQHVWPRVAASIRGERRKLASQIPKSDPARLTTDLLTPIKCALNETLHTQALTYLLDKRRNVEFGKNALRSVLQKIAERCEQEPKVHDIAQSIIGAFDDSETKVEIGAEYNHESGRYDVRVHLVRKGQGKLVIIENKIGAPVSDKQLNAYRASAIKWCAHHQTSFPLFVLLTRERETAKNWVNLTYLELASALRNVWLRLHPGRRQWLGLYIASIIRGIYGADVNERPEDLDRGDVQTYLGGRLQLSRKGVDVDAELPVPAVSREFDFYVRNYSEIDDILESKNGESSLNRLATAVYKRARDKAVELLATAGQEFNRALNNVEYVRIDQKAHWSREKWEWWTALYNGRGPKKKIGSVGFYIDVPLPMLVGWVWLKGGKPLQDDLLHACKGLDAYGEEDYIVWLKRELTTDDTQDQLRNELRGRASSLLKSSKAILKRS